jgi:hypothetical protein
MMVASATARELRLPGEVISDANEAARLQAIAHALEDDPNGQARSKTFLQAFEQLATNRTARSATLSPPHGDPISYGAGG